ncbi:MAG: serpin family protein [Lachnospiraceae bacterium]|nr:serpin family protein [Lachnospiraceae bacterium]
MKKIQDREKQIKTIETKKGKKAQIRKIKKQAAAVAVCALIGSFTCGCSVSDSSVMKDGDVVGSIAAVEESGSVGGNTTVDVDTPQIFSKALFAKSLEETNPVESPLSAYLAMALAGEGAKGDTAAEFDAVMGSDRRTMAEQFMKSFPAQTEGTKVALANSAWVDDRLICEEDWLKAAADNYLAQVYQKRLSKSETMGEINAWVEQNTQGLIKNLLDQPLDDMTRLALFNTIYFKGEWQSAFESSSTTPKDFTLADGNKTQVDMMRKTGKMSYVQADFSGNGAKKAGLCDGVALPYRDSELLFVALRPTGGQSVRELYEHISFGQLGEAVDAAQDAETQVNLWLPKFKVTFDRILNGDMMDMGFAKAFDPDRADFSGIGSAESGDLYISLVRQKAVFIVDEEGTEAAAVTEIIMQTNSIALEEEPKQVHFDEPFLYMIFDPETDMPLFVGIMDDPSLAEN